MDFNISFNHHFVWNIWVLERSLGGNATTLQCIAPPTLFECIDMHIILWDQIGIYWLARIFLRVEEYEKQTYL